MNNDFNNDLNSHLNSGLNNDLSNDFLDAPWRLSRCAFDDDFWPQVVAVMAGQIAPLHEQIIIVPDGSMYVPFARALAAHARAGKSACGMPRMMTLLDWAKSRGASDWDGLHVTRSIDWMAQLKEASQLAQWLAGSSDADVFDLAQNMVALSDELSLHFLAGQAIGVGEAALKRVVDEVYQAQAGVLAQQELAILLQCWAADVQQQTPVVRYLQVLATMVDAPPARCVTVVRNRAWTAHEAWFWAQYARGAQVNVIDVVQVRAVHAVAPLHAAWAVAQSRVLAGAAPVHGAVHIYGAANLEDEAQAVVRQVLDWRAQGLRKIALVALDRTVSRRVWALLGRCGVALRDDTGWLLSTARGASSWQQGFELWADDVSAKLLLDWLAHPLVLADVTAELKENLVRYVRALNGRSKTVLRRWTDWQAAAQRFEPADDVAQREAVHTLALALFERAVGYEKRFAKALPMAQWVTVVLAWADDFGMTDAWRNDAAGLVWLNLLEKWRGVASDVPLRFAAFMRVQQSEVEGATFRPHDVSDEVLLLPLGSTRMRDFEAVWLMGATQGNLPSTARNKGFLNTAARLGLGLPTFMDNHAQAQRDLIDLFARTPQLCASYCVSADDGAPQAVSTWLMQWQRAAGASIQTIALPAQAVAPEVAAPSGAVATGLLPTALSATDLASLLECPYQFYSRKILGLQQFDAPSDEVSPADKGNLWHNVLVDFHQLRGLREVTSAQSDHDDLVTCLRQKLTPLALKNARYWLTLEAFLGYALSYVTWWRAREAQGWRLFKNETKAEINQPIVLEGAAALPLNWNGRIDQIDVREHTDPHSGARTREYAVMDYKTGALGKFQKAIKNGEEVQLAFYLNLFSGEIFTHAIQAGYVGVSDKPVTDLKAEKPHQGANSYPQAWLNASQTSHDASALQGAARLLKEQVSNSFIDMHNGLPLMAMGELTACQYCQVRGLCRKGYTQTPSNNASQKGTHS
jgi:ATP-dependent helicase/nuclease subunit B